MFIFEVKRNLIFIGLCLAICAIADVNLQALWRTGDPAERVRLQDTIQRYSDQTTHTEFMTFDADTSVKTKNPLLLFYDAALERILRQIPEEKPAPGTVTIWYLYNMGFVLKTVARK